VARPIPNEPTKYYRAAADRLGDAQVLLAGDRTTGAVYLAGYAVECALKVLILSATPAAAHAQALAGFRTKRGHDHERLRSLYFKKGGARFPPDIAQHFAFVNGWTTDLRYQTKKIPMDDAEDFLESTTLILEWVKRRL